MQEVIANLMVAMALIFLASRIFANKSESKGCGGGCKCSTSKQSTELHSKKIL
jgi:hypothetical protein